MYIYIYIVLYSICWNSYKPKFNYAILGTWSVRVCCPWGLELQSYEAVSVYDLHAFGRLGC